MHYVYSTVKDNKAVQQRAYVSLCIFQPPYKLAIYQTPLVFDSQTMVVRNSLEDQMSLIVITCVAPLI